MLDEIRKKPQYVKQNYAFWGALLVTGVVAVVWVFSLSIRFEEVDVYTVESSNNPDSSGAFSQFWGELKDKAGSVWTAPPEELMSADTSTEADQQVDEEDSLDEPEVQTQIMSSTSSPIIQIATSSSQSR